MNRQIRIMLKIELFDVSFYSEEEENSPSSLKFIPKSSCQTLIVANGAAWQS